MSKLFIKTLLSLAVVAFLTLGCGALCDGHMLSGDVMRLRVIAESDSDEDQQIKYQIRDTVLDILKPTLKGASDLDEAVELTKQELDSIMRAAYDVAIGAGRDSEIRISLRERSCPRREYGCFALPAGNYSTLQVEIGGAHGRNWWCVVYPDVCAAAARGSICDSGLNEEENSLVTKDGSGYEIRFWLLDTVNGVKARLFG
ncbi:MAG: stage II sporulation protein R [Oscillospiraceae bacterium]|nr:stage II sporulation protein R [Oscillospiraceae bacterium]